MGRWSTFCTDPTLRLVCRGCDYLESDGCHYERIMGRDLPYKPGHNCHFNPHQAAKFYERSKEEMPAKIIFDEVKALELYKEGKSDATIASHLGINQQVIQKWRTKHGLPATHEKGATKAKSEVIIANPPCQEIAIPKPIEPDNEPIGQGSEEDAPMNLKNLAELLGKLAVAYPDAQVVSDCVMGESIVSVSVSSHYDNKGNLVGTCLYLD